MDRNLRIRMLLEAGDKVTRPLRDIAAGSSRAAQALKTTRDRLRELERVQGTVAAFRQIKAAVGSTKTELDSAQDRVAALARQMAATSTPTKKLAADFARAKRDAAALKQEHQEQGVKLQQLRDRLNAAGVSTSNLGGHERKLRGDIARTNAELAEQERRLRSVADRSQRFEAARGKFTAMQGTATGLAAGGFSAIETGRAMLRPMTGAVGDAMTHESSMTDIAQKADLSREAAARMGNTVLDIAAKANQLPEAIREGIDTLSGFGLDPRQALQMMQPIGRAATAYKAQIADLSAAAFAANDNLKVPVEQTGRVIDIMAAAGKRGAFEVKDMAQYFPALTAASQALGQKGAPAVADLAAALQVARKGAGNSETAATNVANVLQKISSPQTIKAFKKFGIDLPASLKKAYADGKTPLEAIAELTKKATGGDLSKIGFLFEDAQVQAGLRPLIQNMEEYRSIREAAMASGGTVDTDFAERMKDGAEKAKAFKVGAQELSITLGALLLPAAIKVMGVVNRAGKSFSTWAKANPGFAKGLAITAAVLAALFVVLGGGAIAIAGIIAPFAALAAAATFLGIGMLPLTGIVLAIVAAIALLAGAGYLIYKNWGAIGAWFAGVWESIKSTVSAGIAALSQVIMRFTPVGLFVRGFTAVLAFLQGPMPGRMMEAGKAIVQGLIRGIGAMLGALKSAIVNAASAAAGWFKQKLGIRSPSRVFMGFGDFMMQGLAQGIEGGRNLPIERLNRLSRDIGTAVALGTAAPAMAGAAPFGGAAGATPDAASLAPAGPVTINIYPPRGTSATEIADAVKRALENERRRKPGGGGSFADAPDWSDHA
ncbi:phage tail tape measure protein [Sphingomonas sp. LT1P40]|uniref:phage tail tape measure protein n=1 Tax=Alteristakelama amylovorans TaxID=3096166 RepID=UPI002FC8631D